MDPFVGLVFCAQDEWRYYHDPVVRPAKGHLWATGFEDDGEHGKDAWWCGAIDIGWTVVPCFYLLDFYVFFFKLIL